MQSEKFQKLVNELLKEANKTNQPLVVLYGDEDLSAIKCIGDFKDPYMRSCISDLVGYALRQLAQTGEKSSEKEARNTPL